MGAKTWPNDEQELSMNASHVHCETEDLCGVCDVNISRMTFLRNVFLKGEVDYLGLDEILELEYSKAVAPLLGSVMECSASVTFQYSTLNLLDPC